MIAFRAIVEATDWCGLEPGVSGPLGSDIEVDELVWIQRARIDAVVGHLADDIRRRVDAALLALLDLKKYLLNHNP